MLFSGQDRSYPSLQAQLYKQGYGYLCNKKNRPSHGRHAATELLPPVVNLPVPEKSTDPSKLPVALGIISKSLCSLQQKSSGTQTIETEMELRASPWRAPQEGRSQEGGSASENADSDPELVAGLDCPRLAVIRLDGCGSRSVVQKVSVDSNETFDQRKEPLGAFSPDLQSSVECRSDIECIDGLQVSWSGENSLNYF